MRSATAIFKKLEKIKQTFCSGPSCDGGPPLSSAKEPSSSKMLHTEGKTNCFVCDLPIQSHQVWELSFMSNVIWHLPIQSHQVFLYFQSSLCLKCSSCKNNDGFRWGSLGKGGMVLTTCCASRWTPCLVNPLQYFSGEPTPIFLHFVNPLQYFSILSSIFLKCF